MTDLENKDNNALDFVTLMTIHTSKWLEYSRVFITWLEDGLFPSSRSMTDLKDLEEEFIEQKSNININTIRLRFGGINGLRLISGYSYKGIRHRFV